MDRKADVSRLLERGAFDELTEVVYEELRGLAGAYIRNERAGHTLQPTALANEVYLRLVDETRIEWTGRAQFMAIAARSMRQILIQHARKKGAAKRGGDRTRISLSDTTGSFDQGVVDLLDLNDALDALAAIDERGAQIVELRFFAGLTAKEVSEMLQLSLTTVEDDWYAARAWLRRRLATG